MVLPQEYTIQKFHQLAGYAKAKHGGSIIEGGCPICKEVKSWGRKRRLYYMIKDDYIYCHNCGWSGNPIKFIQQVDTISYNEIVEEANEYDVLPKFFFLLVVCLFSCRRYCLGCYALLTCVALVCQFVQFHGRN